MEGSRRILREEYPELEEFLWGDSFGWMAILLGQKGARNEGGI